jgi:hypothetical protein
VDVMTRWMTPTDILIAAPSPTIVVMNGGVPWIRLDGDIGETR